LTHEADFCFNDLFELTNVVVIMKRVMV
jgi:hypothetical protein